MLCVIYSSAMLYDCILFRNSYEKTKTTVDNETFSSCNFSDIENVSM